MDIYRIQNVEKVLEAVRKQGCKLTGISASDIVRGVTNTVMGLVWQILKVYIRLFITFNAEILDWTAAKGR
jgi:hypothetical protein